MKYILWLPVVLLIFGPSMTKAASFEGRDYELFLPETALTPAPAVLMLHGARGSGPRFRETTGFDAIAERYGVAAIYPTAPDAIWNDGRGGDALPEAVRARDDVGYLLDLIDELAADGLVDPDHVYVAGHSNGGGMTLRLACEQPDAFRGIGVVATKQLIDLPCPSDQPIPAVFFHGTADPLSPHEGRPTGTEGRGRGDKGRSYSSAETLQIWAERNRCRRSAEPIRLDPDKDDGTEVFQVDFEDCTAALRYFEIVDGGHPWPGGDEGGRLMRRLLGPGTRDIDAGEEILRFWQSP